jgi:hypothetical protein
MGRTCNMHAKDQKCIKDSGRKSEKYRLNVLYIHEGDIIKRDLTQARRWGVD